MEGRFSPHPTSHTHMPLEKFEKKTVHFEFGDQAPIHSESYPGWVQDLVKRDDHLQAGGPTFTLNGAGEKVKTNHAAQNQNEGV